MSRISEDQVKKVAQLARIDLNETEVKYHAIQIDKILDYINQLEKIDTENIECTTRAIEVVNVLRDDKKENFNDKESILNQAPSREGDFFKVPKIIND